MHPVLALVLVSNPLAHGEAPQWGSFRGNNGAGVAASGRLPEALDPESNLQWRVEVPSGYSSPVIAGKNLFLTGATGTLRAPTVSGKLVALCLDAATGETRWQKEFDLSGPRPGQNSCAAPTPATDGEVVVTLFHHLGLVAFDTSGKELWRQTLAPFNIPHVMSTSPVIHGQLVILQVDQDGGAYLVAFDKQSGKERWRVAREGVAHSYATPAIHTAADGTAEVVVSGTYQVAAYALADGAKRWWMDGAAWQTKCVPIFAKERCFLNSFMPSLGEMEYGTFSGSFAERDADHDGFVTQTEYGDEKIHTIWFLFDQDHDKKLSEQEWGAALKSNSATGGLFAIELGSKGDVTSSKVKWKVDDRRSLSDVTSPILVNDVLFTIQEGGVLTSLDPETGKVQKQERVGQPDSYYASPVAGDGKLYLASQSGILTVVKAAGEWEQLASHPLEDEEVWATPAMVGSAVYVRGKSALYCFERMD